MKKKIQSLLMFSLILFFILSSFNTTVISDTEASPAEVVSLKEVYKDYFMIGNVVSPFDLNNAEKYEFMKFHYNALTPENATKPNSLWPDAAGEPSFTSADNMLSQVNADGFYTMGHALAWHNQSNAWPPSDLNYEEARASLELYISTVAGHFNEGANKLDAWDVVNEAFRDNPENPTDWRNALRSGENPVERPSRWFEAYANGGNGWDYIYDAFLFARQADPDATLYYNDFNDEELASKAIAIASMVTELNERYANEYPEANGRKLIEGIGIQGHYNTRLNIDNLDEVLKIYSKTGAKISVTELDVQHNGTTANIPPTEEQMKEQAEVYAKIFSLYKKHSENIERVTFWGVADNNSWRRTGYPLPFDNERAPKEAYWAIINPEAYLGIDESPPTLKSFEFNGEVFDVAGETEFDINVPSNLSNIDFSIANLSHNYSADDVDVSMTLSPENGVVAAGEPAVATVEIAWKDKLNTTTTYTMNFGHMTAEWGKDLNYPDTGYLSTLNIRFSDGETEHKLFQTFYNKDDNRVAMINSEEYQPLPKHTSGTFTINMDNHFDEDYLKTLTLKKSLWDQKWNPIIPTLITDFDKPDNYYRLAKTIESGKTYIIVPARFSVALTNMNVDSVDPTNKRGLAGTPVTIEEDIIIEPELIQDNTRFIFNEQTSPDPGPYTSENGYTGFTMLSLVHGGLVAPSIVYRDTGSDSVVALRTDSTIANSDLDRAVWFNTGIDPDTGETTIFSHTGASGETYALYGTENGFVNKKVDSLEGDSSLRVKLYEHVSDYLYEDISSFGQEMDFSPVEYLVSDRDVNIPVTADVPDGFKAFLKKDGATIASTNFVNGQALISVNREDIDANANYAVVIYNDSEVIGAEIIPVVSVDNATPEATVEKIKGNQNKLTVTVTEVYSDGNTVDYTEEILIENNSADIYQVGPYNVYVDTKGNTEIRECYIVW